MKIGSLFAGIGGFEFAAQQIGWETAWYSEIDPYACAVMKKNFPHIPNLGDIQKINGKSIEQVDILVGGFPCQDVSYAGKGAGLAGKRSGLWKEYARLIGELKPRYVVAENVTALRTRGLDTVLKDLSAVGYDAEWHCIPAGSVGAPHRRDRIWVLAYPNSDIDFNSQSRINAEESRLESEQRQEINTSRELGGTSSSVRGVVLSHSRYEEVKNMDETHFRRALNRWSFEPGIHRMVDGVPYGMDRLRCVGNAIVPQVAYMIFKTIQLYENQKVSYVGNV
jgi:DNA (cytosine-5)-methyltransferase 1